MKSVIVYCAVILLALVGTAAVLAGPYIDPHGEFVVTMGPYIDPQGELVLAVGPYIDPSGQALC